MLLKTYSDFGGGKIKSDSEFLSYNLMSNSGKKIRALRDKKNKYSNSCCPKKISNKPCECPNTGYCADDTLEEVQAKHWILCG